MSLCYSDVGFDDRSFAFDDSSSDSGYEKSYETEFNVMPRKLFCETSTDFFNSTAELPLNGNLNNSNRGQTPPFLGLLDTSSNHSSRSGRTLVEHIISKTPQINNENGDFKPTQTSTPTKKSTNGGDCSDGEQPTEPKPKRKYAVGKNRVTRSRSPTQVVRIKKFRRMKANDRERNRMHTLNDALERLRVTLPSLPEETKLTKIEILRFAHNYIFALEQVLESGGTINLDLEKLQNFTLSGERITKELFDALFVNPQPYSTYPMSFGLAYAAHNGRVPYVHGQVVPQIHSQYMSAYSSNHLPIQHSLQHQANYQHQSTEYNAYNYYNNARQYNCPEAPVAETEVSNKNKELTMSTNFCPEKYALFKGTFDAAVKSSSSNHYQHHHQHHHQQHAAYQSNGGDFKPTVTLAELSTEFDHKTLQKCKEAMPTTPASIQVPMHYQSSFYSQTPPWKDFNEQMVNAPNGYENFSTL